MAVRKVSPQEAWELVSRDGYTYVDVRSTGEYAQGHPQGSANVPVAEAGAGGMAPNADFLGVMQSAYPKDAKLVVGCMAGGRSARACAMLEQAGYTNLVDQRAGWGGSGTEPGWAAAKLPAATGPDAENGYEAIKRRKG